MNLKFHLIYLMFPTLVLERQASLQCGPQQLTEIHNKLQNIGVEYYRLATALKLRELHIQVRPPAKHHHGLEKCLFKQ